MKKICLILFIICMLAFSNLVNAQQCPVDCGGGNCCRAGEQCCTAGCCPVDKECCFKDGKQKCCNPHTCTIADRDRKEAQCDVDRGCKGDLICQSNCLNYANGWYQNGCK